MEEDRQGKNTAPTGGFEAPDPAELSRLLAGYEVSQLIACGGMGAVYVARQKSLDRDVAIKILPPEFGKDPQFRAGFEAEAKAMARLNHPNLIAVYDFGEVDEFLYIIMEMVKGKSLHHSAHGKAIDQREVARLIHGICRGLAHAHEAGIIHRDIKPANILLSPKKDPKIGDFGLARPIDDAKGDGMHFGTPGYTAPEVMKDPAKADERSDVFATGVILYELLTGGLPGKTYVPASQGGTGIDPRFDRIVRRAMHPAPAMRFADARAMADAVGDLKEALGESGAGSLKTGTRSVRTGDPESGKAAASPAAMQAPIDPYRGLASKLAIIVVLLGAIFGLWNLYVKEKARRDRINTELANKKPGPVLPPIPKPPKPPVPVPKPEPEPEPAPPPETPLEALTRLQNALAGGERGRFPPGTHERDGSWYFLVEDSMDWWEACRFAEEHGGHLATLANGEEQAWLAGQIPGGTTVWLGGVSSGGKEWGWIDGSKWVVAAPYTSTLSFACLSEHGKLLAKTRGQRFPFFICWHAGGENPGSLASQLERLRGSLEGPDPSYPPGTLTHGSGRYLVIEQPTTWSAAARIATNAGGHLAVPSDKTESDFLHDAVTSALPEGGAAWIGGRHDGSKWTWTTGESMSFGDWRANAPDGDEAEETALRLVGGPGGGWDDANPLNDAATSALVVEWSEGRKAPVVPVPPVQPNDWAELRQRAVDLVAKEQAKFAAGILKNGDGLTRDLDAYFFKLDRANRARFGPAFAGAKAMVTPEGRIVMPALKSTIRPLPPGGATIFDHYFRGQETLETDNERALKNVHHHYVKQLAEKRDEARELGLTTEVRAIENEIDACGSDGQALLEHLAPEPQ